jgi:glycosyltransferase involved in cell wall biosynthesis
MQRFRIDHVITNTSVGGAEMMLCKLLARLDCREFDFRVIALMERGETGRKIEQLGVPVIPLHLTRYGVPNPAILATLTRLLRERRADVVQTWLYHADLCGGVAAKLAGGLPVVWNIRHSALDPKVDSRSLRWVVRLCNRLSRRLPARIVVNSEAARADHVRLGYPADRMTVIPNGFDLDHFHPATESRRAIRGELRVNDDAVLVGLVGRFHVYKDHRTFVEAASRVATQLPQARFVLAGRGVTWDNDELAGWIDRRGLRPRFHLLGPRSDVASIYAALDTAVCCSLTESFPNVVGEAMACGVPPVVTAVGDCPHLVGETGTVVSPQDPAALAAAIVAMLRLPAEERAARGQAARRRILRDYEIGTIAERYVDLWAQVRCSARRQLKAA